MGYILTVDVGAKLSNPIRHPFHKIVQTGREFEYLKSALEQNQLSYGGPFSKKCQEEIERITGCKLALLTHSCTTALEIAAILAGIGPGDEVIMPSFAFASTANAFVLRGAVPVFVEIRPDTLNLDEQQVEAAIGEHTKAIVPVHYSGVSCEMDSIMGIAEAHRLVVIEDAAQAFLATYRGEPVGSRGNLAAISFHQTKNITAGEGGALLINDERFVSAAHVVTEKGTNRQQFLLGQVDKYSWIDAGSSPLPGELTAAYLLAQLEEAEKITARRRIAWERYHMALETLEHRGLASRPKVPRHCGHNAHIYYLLLTSLEHRTATISWLKKTGIQAQFHYVPLHSAPAGQKFCRQIGALPITTSVAERLLRLPLWTGIEEHVPEIADLVIQAVTETAPTSGRAV